MNFSRVNKFSAFVSRIAPSKISARLGFPIKKEKEDDVGLEHVTTSQPQDPLSPSDPIDSSIEDAQSSLVHRRVNKETTDSTEDEQDRLGEIIIPQNLQPSTSRSAIINVATQFMPESTCDAKRESIQSSSSQSSSIEEALKRAIGSVSSDEFEDAFVNRFNKVAGGEDQHQTPSENQEQHEPPLQQNLEEVLLPPPAEIPNAEEEGFELQNLPNAAAASPPSSGRSSSQSNHVSVDLGGAGESEEKRNPTYVEAYLGYMYKLGLSPFLPEGSSPGFWGCCQVALFVQVALYWVFSIAAILEAFSVSKASCIAFVYLPGTLEDFTDMFYFIMNVCLNIYSAYLFTIQQRRFAKMIKSIRRLRAFAERYSKVEDDEYQTTWILFLVITSLVMSTLSVVFASGFTGWTPEDGVMYFTYKASVATHLWTTGFYNSTEMDALWPQYRFNATAGKVVVGLIYGAMRLCNRAMASANADLILTTGATVKKQMLRFAKEVENPDHDINPVTLENFEARGGQWEHYQLLQEAVDDTNDTFDSLLKYLHVQNVMLFVYIIMNAFDSETKFMTTIYMVYNTIKASCTYRIASQASEKNETFRDWIRRIISNSTDKNLTRKAKVILDKMKEHPLGLGKGQFLIDESFLFRFLGTVGSVFVLQAQSRESEKASG